MNRTFRFKLKPTRAQHDKLRAALEYSRQLYNAALEERIDYYRKTGRTRTRFDQYLALTELRAGGAIYSLSMERAPIQALDLAYKAFFRKGGFPRFKGRDWFKSIGWSEPYGWCVAKGIFAAKGLGRLRIAQHRELPSEPSAARIKREGRHWFLTLVCKVPAAEQNDVGPAIGADLGISTFAALSDGTLIPNQRHAKRGQAKLRRRQRALARCKLESRRRQKVRARVASAHLQVRRARRTYHFQVAAKLVRDFSLIAVEDLNVKGLAQSALAREVNNVAWGGFLKILFDKAESAGRTVMRVDPRYTSQTCPMCGTIAPKKLSERIHACSCGYTADRDVAAAQVILSRAVCGPGAVNVGGCAERPRGKAVVA